MFGEIVTNASAGVQGLIASEDGSRFSFTRASWRTQPVGPTVGMRVEFEPRASHAVNIRPAHAVRSRGPGASVGSSPSSSPLHALQPQGASNVPSPLRRPGNGSPRAQPRGTTSNGSILSAIREMLAVFLLTPLTWPIFALLPVFGRLELFMAIALPGFLGGRRAGSVKKAMAAAVVVGTLYGLVCFFVALAVLDLVLGLPHLGGHLERGLNAVGGPGVTSGLVAGLTTAPFVLLLLASSFVGALTRTMRR